MIINKELKKSNQIDDDYNLLKQYIDINNVIKQLNKDLKTLNAGLEEDLKKKLKRYNARYNNIAKKVLDFKSPNQIVEEYKLNFLSA